MPEQIVLRVETPIEPTKFEKNEFVMPSRKDGTNLQFETYVIATPEEGGFHKKKGLLSLNFPGWGNWEVHCDEGTGGQGLGLDSAPSPMGYLSLGIAFCLMTHIKGLSRKFKLEITDLRIEQRLKFSSDIDFEMKGEAIQGACDGLETHIIIDSPASEERLAEFMQIAEDACLGLQTIINAVPSSTTLYVNDKEVGMAG